MMQRPVQSPNLTDGTRPARGAGRQRGYLVAAGAFALAFVVLSLLVQQGDTLELDRAIALAFRTTGTLMLVGPAWLQEAARDITGLGSVSVSALALVIAVSQCAAARLGRTAWMLMVGVVSGVAVCFVLKVPLARPRPNLVGNAPQVFTASYPSAHSFTSVLLFWLLGLLLVRIAPTRAARRLTVLTLAVLTLLIGLSRIYLGVHWTTDVLAGWCGGSAWALFVWWLAEPWCRPELGRAADR